MRDGQPCRTPTAQLRRSGTWAKFSPMTRGRLDSPNVRLNPPTIQFAPSLWAAVCMIGLGVFVQKLFEFPVGTSGWQGGIAGIVLVVFGFVQSRDGGSRPNARSRLTLRGLPSAAGCNSSRADPDRGSYGAP
jgi:hypothetical protein